MYPQQLYAQLHTRLALQINDYLIISKADHPMEVVGSHCHLLISNVKVMGSVPPPFCQRLHLNSTSMTL